MTKLSQRKSRLKFEVSTEVRSGRKLRAIIVECGEYTATIRLKGTRQRLEVDWEGVYVLAAKKEANRVRAEKLAAKGGKR